MLLHPRYWQGLYNLFSNLKWTAIFPPEFLCIFFFYGHFMRCYFLSQILCAGTCFPVCIRDPDSHHNFNISSFLPFGQVEMHHASAPARDSFTRMLDDVGARCAKGRGQSARGSRLPLWEKAHCVCPDFPQGTMTRIMVSSLVPEGTWAGDSEHRWLILYGPPPHHFLKNLYLWG